MQTLFDICPRVLEFTSNCGHRTVKAGESSTAKLTANLLLYSESAELTVKTEREELTLSAGSALLLPIGSNIFFQIHQDGGLTVISYRPINRAENQSPILLTTAAPKRTRLAFLQFANACEEKKPLRELAMLSAFYTALYLLARNSKSGNRLFLKEHTLHAARAYLDRHYTDPNLRVTDAAEKAGISPTYLRRLFLSVEGCTPLQYVTDLRIRQAKKLMESGEHSMEEVTRACGLSDVNYLKKLLKNVENTEKNE